MCGYFYSNKFCPEEETLGNLKKRGPDYYARIETPLGYFAHSLLITKPPMTKQPFKSEHGILLYNGTIYNTEGNDTQWLCSKLDNNIDSCVQVIKSLRGEFSITWVTEDFVIFCPDQWVTRNLWFYFSEQENTLSISSTPDVLRKIHTGAWPCKPNTIYILDKRKSFSLQTRVITEWNLDQKVTNYDKVWEEFETAVDLRINGENAIGLSSGYDSGVIACALHNRFKKHNAVYYMLPGRENADILEQRRKIHRAKVIVDKPTDQSVVEEFCKLTKQPSADTKRINYYQLICNWSISKGKRIHLTGRGGDEIYSDYGFKGKFLDPSSTFGGYWPDQLDLVWPWHSGRSYLLEATTLQDFALGHWGCEGRLPLLDQQLVQTWLNTTHTLKNARYKGWMSNYMDQFDYPYCESDLKLAGFPSK